MFKTIEFSILNWLESVGVNKSTSEILVDFGAYILLIVLSLLTFYLARRILLSLIHQLTKKSKNKWDDILLEQRFFRKLSYLLPAYLIFTFTPILLAQYPQIVSAILTILIIYMVIVVIMAVNSFLDAVMVIYQDFTIAKSKPIKGYIQIVKIIVICIGVIVILANLFGKNPLGLIGGLGAFSAVLLLVFKDPILGFIGGIQLSAYNMLVPGDWISMPKFNADGTVIDISLTTVKVQNWDKTISTIPTYSLITDSFKNWRGMEESGGRRIKRAINIDMRSVKFCTHEMLNKFRKISDVQNYVENTQKNLEEYNKERNIDNSILVNGRRQTNLGVFRAYLRGYLHNRPDIHDDMTFLIRQLNPTEKGIPMEIYVFSKIQDWAKYEDLQSDIFDHVLAVIPEFDLNVFQSPSGDDFSKLIN